MSRHLSMRHAMAADAVRFSLYIEKIIEHGLLTNIQRIEGHAPSKLEMLRHCDCDISAGITGAWVWRWKGEIVFIRKPLTPQNPLQLDFAEPEKRGPLRRALGL